MVKWHAFSGNELFKRFNSGEGGISKQDAKERLEKYGYNQIESGKKISAFSLILEQFTSPLVLILIVASAISFFFGHGIDGALILGIVILNGIFGFVQNYNAEKSIEALRKMGSPKALVLRDGSVVEIDSSLIVPGDILILREGMKIPADSRLLECENLEADESVLTGESVPVSKNTEKLPEKIPLADRVNMVFMNTLITKGKGKAIVVETGSGTEVGKIASQLESIEKEPTRFHKEIAILSKKISIGILGLVLLIAVTLFLLHSAEPFEIFFTSISLAVAAIPEGLPAVVTISLAIATQVMLKKKSLVRKLPVVEALGSVNVICTDKTGTLTENSMTVQEIYCNNESVEISGTGKSINGEFLIGGKKADSEELDETLLCGMACNDTVIEWNNNKPSFFGDPTEVALTVSALKRDISLKGMKRVKDIPFTSERKRMSTVYEKNGKMIVYSKGAPEVILESCSYIMKNGRKVKLTLEMRKEILEKNEEMAGKALRVLGFAFKGVKEERELEKGMTFLGLQGMIDPPRSEIADSLRIAREAGIRVVMLTGDNMITARAVGSKIGFSGKVINSTSLNALSEQEFRGAVEEYDIFARVSPEQKLKIMQALKEKGYSVAMTGDGVNDAPALKQSDVGIAMGIRGTDVSKEAADIVLLDDNFVTIVEAVKQGRTVFDNIQKFVNYLLTNNLAEVLIVFFASLAGHLPLLPAQLLWINLLTDGTTALALGADPPKPGIMKQKPRAKNEEIITNKLGLVMIVIGSIITLVVLGLFFYYLPKGIAMAQTMVFTSLIMYEFVRVVVIREREALSLFSNKWLIGAMALSIVMQLAVLYNPLENLIPLKEMFGVVHLGIMDWILIIAGGIMAYFASLFASRIILGKEKNLEIEKNY